MAQNLDVSTSPSGSNEMARIAATGTGATLFFDHRGSAMISAIGNRRILD